MEDKVEYEANRFMVELLSWDEKQERDETMEQFAKRIGVPAEMMRYKVIK